MCCFIHRDNAERGRKVEADLCFNPQGDSCGACPSLNPGAGDAAALRGEPGIKGEPGLPGMGERGLPVSAAHIPRWHRGRNAVLRVLLFLFIFFNGPDAFFYEVTGRCAESSNSTFSLFDFDLIGHNKVFCLFFPPAKRHTCVCLSSKEKVNLLIWWESELDAMCKVFLFLRCLHPATCSCGGSLNWAWFVEGVGADGGGGGRKWIWSLMRVSAQRFPIMSASIRHIRSGK